ncbi:MAG: glycosyltransferase [bacterium]|nr:glycosyltransferase [bacterium]
MRIALVHDYLNQWGGGERVLQVLGGMFPEADIYTLLHDANAVGGRFARRAVHTSFLDTPFIRKHHRWFIPLMPIAAELMTISGYDLVISDSSGFAKGVHVAGKTPHISYIHSPLRYAWDKNYLVEELKHVNLFSYFPSFILRAATAPIAWYLRRWDKRAATKPQLLLANSNYIAEQISRHYGRAATTLYPPVDTSFFSHDPRIARKNYFLAVSRFVSYKRLDLLIDTFNVSHLPLKIVGAGRDEARLRARAASPNIEFVGAVYDEKLRALYREATAFLFPQVEDFGLAAAEATACGTPVIAYAAGGALEIVRDGENGVLFREQTPTALVEAIARCQTTSWDHAAIAISAERFSQANFEAGIRAAIARLR